MNTPAPSVVDVGAPSVKLPLAARKSLRDKWEPERPGLEQKVSSITGVPWSFPIDYGLIWDDIEEGSYGKNNPGKLTYEYAKEFVEHLEKYKAKHGQAGIDELNRVAHSHAVILAKTDKTQLRRCGTEILDDGIFRIIFSPGGVGVNVSDCCTDILGTVSKAGEAVAKAGPGGASSALDFTAKSNIATEWDAKVESLTTEFKKILAAPVFTLSPNFEANASAMAAYESAHSGKCDLRDDWRPRIGEFTYLYFEEAKKRLVDLKFDKDDMLQDGFKEAVEKNELSLRVGEKLNKGSYNEALIEQGVLVIQTKPDAWGSNVGDPMENIVNLL